MTYAEFIVSLSLVNQGLFQSNNMSSKFNNNPIYLATAVCCSKLKQRQTLTIIYE